MRTSTLTVSLRWQKIRKFFQNSCTLLINCPVITIVMNSLSASDNNTNDSIVVSKSGGSLVHVLILVDYIWWVLVWPAVWPVLRWSLYWSPCVTRNRNVDISQLYQTHLYLVNGSDYVRQSCNKLCYTKNLLSMLCQYSVTILCHSMPHVTLKNSLFERDGASGLVGLSTQVRQKRKGDQMLIITPHT